MKNYIALSCIALLASSGVAEEAMARSNILSGGVSLSYDYQDRQDDEGASIALDDSDDDDYSRLFFSPFLQLVSSSPRDRLEISVAPGVRYDLDNSETDLDGTLTVAAERFLTSAWQVNASNTLFRGDYDVSDSEVEEPVEPDLSTDLGRRRYYRNSLIIGSDYRYRPDSLFHIGLGWIILRNDDASGTIQEYDRYSMEMRNEHRYTARWKSIVDLTVVRGDFEEDTDTTISDDLYEYSAELGLENNSIPNNPLILTYYYDGIRYDEDLQLYSDIHELQFSWRHDFSSRFYTIVGGGPSYIKIEGSDGNWEGNGILEAYYEVVRGTYRLTLEKGYETDNFSGTEERGVVEFYSAELFFTRQLTRKFDLDGRLAYRNEERSDSATATNSFDSEEEQYIAGVGLDYKFWQHYTARIDYTFIAQDSDIAVDNYDDHRVAVTLTWENDLLHW